MVALKTGSALVNPTPTHRNFPRWIDPILRCEKNERRRLFRANDGD
jgi:hypothetical protein